MKKDIYRPQVRLSYEQEDERAIIEKIRNRNKILHKSVNDYIKHAIYAFEDDKKTKRIDQNCNKERQESSSVELDMSSLLDHTKF